VAPVANSADPELLPTSSQYCEAPIPVVQLNVAEVPAMVAPAAGELMCAAVFDVQLEAALYAVTCGGRCQSAAPV
jgi:hypothetical protein